MEKKESVGISTLEFQKVMIVLAEKRTAHTTFRSGIAVSVLPLTIISFLIATDARYSIEGKEMMAGFVLFGCCVLFLLGGYLIKRGLSRIKFHDRKIAGLLGHNPELSSIFFHKQDGLQLTANISRSNNMHNDIVFHFDKGEQELNISISNIKNYFSALKNEEFSAVLVVNGPGIQLLGNEGNFSDQISELHELGLSIRVCNNALNHFNIKPDWLNPVCQIVPAGIIEIVDLQRSGFAYLKP